MMNSETANPKSPSDLSNAPELSKVCVVVSAPVTAVAFLRDQLVESSRLYDLTVVANAPDGRFLEEIGVKADFISVPIKRQISPVYDLTALVTLFRIFRKGRFDLVHSVTPKAGLLAMSAAFLAAVPARLHTYTGQVWATRKGVSRVLLKNMDRLIGAFATHILVDSASQKVFLLENNVVGEAKARVLGHGSISGVDVSRFRPNPVARAKLRLHYGFAPEATVFLYVGRLNRDKGILDLLEAFERVAAVDPDSRLVLVGPDENGLDSMVSASPVSHRITREGYTAEPERYMAAADVFVLPSYREGFGSTVIEAAAVGIPTVASRIYGLIDAVVDGETGILFGVGDIEGLSKMMLRLAENPNERANLGANAQCRARKDFRMEVVTGHVLEFYRKVLAGAD